MLLSEEEVKIKSQLWFAENADFLKEQEGVHRYSRVSYRILSWGEGNRTVAG